MTVLHNEIQVMRRRIASAVMRQHREMITSGLNG